MKKYLYSEILKIENRVKDPSEMFANIVNLNKSNTLTSDCRLVSFDIIYMLLGVNNISGLKVVKSIFEVR